MHISITDKKKAENSETLQLNQADKAVLLNTERPFSEIMMIETASGELSAGDAGIKLPDIDMFYDTVSMDINDALFFINLAHNGQFSLQAAENGASGIVQTETVQNAAVQKSAAVTNQVINLIEKAQSTQKPVRISFDNDISVVLRIDKKGKLSAEFIPGSIEAERYISANVPALKQRFDEQNLPYTSLSYRQQNRQEKNGRDKNQKGDK